jgi:hypothetical protein
VLVGLKVHGVEFFKTPTSKRGIETPIMEIELALLGRWGKRYQYCTLRRQKGRGLSPRIDTILMPETIHLTKPECHSDDRIVRSY